MINILNYSIDRAYKKYVNAWQKLVSENELEVLNALPTTLSCKVARKQELFEILHDNSELIEQVHIGTVNDRYIASAFLYKPLVSTLWVLKILEKRPGSSDPLGLDSLDFLINDLEITCQVLIDKGLNVQKDHNDMHQWLSLRFGESDEFEAKFVNHLLTHVATAELKQSEQAILNQLAA